MFHTWEHTYSYAQSATILTQCLLWTRDDIYLSSSEACTPPPINVPLTAVAQVSHKREDSG